LVFEFKSCDQDGAPVHDHAHNLDLDKGTPAHDAVKLVRVPIKEAFKKISLDVATSASAASHPSWPSVRGGLRNFF
jgi:hypothetical protein